MFILGSFWQYQVFPNSWSHLDAITGQIMMENIFGLLVIMILSFDRFFFHFIKWRRIKCNKTGQNPFLTLVVHFVNAVTPLCLEVNFPSVRSFSLKNLSSWPLQSPVSSLLSQLIWLLPRAYPVSVSVCCSGHYLACCGRVSILAPLGRYPPPHSHLV